jgi:hypothetical protein
VADRERLAHLTDRWRARHDARRPALDDRPAASPEREALATDAFPYRSVAPEVYVAEHGAEMPGFTFDDVAYRDPELDAWIVEIGRLLRQRRTPG